MLPFNFFFFNTSNFKNFIIFKCLARYIKYFLFYFLFSIQKKITLIKLEMIENSSSRIEFSQVISKISEEKWDDLPPGGGLHAK